MVTPPPHHLQRMGLHWVKYRHDSSPVGWEYMLLQWNPGSQTWTRYNEHDTMRGPLELNKSCVYHSPAPQYLFDPYESVEGISPENYPLPCYYEQALFEVNTVLSALADMNKAQLEAVKAALDFRMRNF